MYGVPAVHDEVAQTLAVTVDGVTATVATHGAWEVVCPDVTMASMVRAALRRIGLMVIPHKVQPALTARPPALA